MPKPFAPLGPVTPGLDNRARDSSAFNELFRGTVEALVINLTLSSGQTTVAHGLGREPVAIIPIKRSNFTGDLSWISSDARSFTIQLSSGTDLRASVVVLG